MEFRPCSKLSTQYVIHIGSLSDFLAWWYPRWEFWFYLRSSWQYLYVCSVLGLSVPSPPPPIYYLFHFLFCVLLPLQIIIPRKVSTTMEMPHCTHTLIHAISSLLSLSLSLLSFLTHSLFSHPNIVEIIVSVGWLLTLATCLGALLPENEKRM